MPLLEVENLRTRFATDRGIVNAVDGVSFTLERGEILGLVGESGSGKSATALSVLRLMREPPAHVDADRLVFDGVDLLAANRATLRSMHGPRMAIVFQDPMRSLNPVLTVGFQLTESLRKHLRLSRDKARKRAVELLEMVGIPLAEKRLSSYPHQFSGGMRQRLMIAIALSCNPALLVADEATTALDVTIQAQIVDLIKKLARELGTAVIWISHDLGLIAGLCDRVNIMYAGRIVETGSVRDVFYNPGHGYTLGLIGCTPRIDKVGQPLTLIKGSPPDLTRPIPLCPFLPRCAISIEDCHRTAPGPKALDAGHVAYCHAASGLDRSEGIA